MWLVGHSQLNQKADQRKRLHGTVNIGRRIIVALNAINDIAQEPSITVGLGPQESNSGLAKRLDIVADKRFLDQADRFPLVP